MKNTRTYVIKLKSILSFLCLSSVIVILFFSFSAEGLYNLIFNTAVRYSKNTSYISEFYPVLSRKKEDISNSAITKILSVLLNEKLDNPSRVISDKLAFIVSVKDKLSANYSFINESNIYYVPKIIKNIIQPEDNINYNPAIATTIKSIKPNGTEIEKMGITLNNKSGYSVDINSLYNKPLKIKRVKNAPQILIVHTHGSESYNPTDRNKTVEKSVVNIGREMKKIFEENNIKVIHSEKMHDLPKYNNSYNNTLKTINEMLDTYPSINIVLDIHRDAMIKDNGEVLKVVKEKEGKIASQVMFVVGTDKGGLQHDNWRENLKFAFKCQKAVNKLYPDLARPIDLREERFNQHATLGSIIIEVGTNGNTMIESVEAAKVTAQAISDVVNSL